MGYQFTFDRDWTPSTAVKIRVFTSGPDDSPRREVTLTIESGDGNAGTVTTLSESFSDGNPTLHQFRELALEIQNAIEFAEIGDVTDGGQ